MKELIKMSSKGQIVIPKRMREETNFQPGDQFMIEWNGEYMKLSKLEKEKQKPEASLVRELLGKYKSYDNELDLTPSNVRKLRENLYGKIDD